MTISLRLYDGISYFDLIDGSAITLISLDLGSGEMGDVEVTGSMRLHVTNTITSIQTKIQTIQRMLQRGIQYWNRSSGNIVTDSQDLRVYLEYKNSTHDSDYWRSPIVNASFAMTENSQYLLDTNCGQIEYVIDFTRKNYWEGPETQLYLANAANPLPTSTGDFIKVYNPTAWVRGTTISFTAAVGPV